MAEDILIGTFAMSSSSSSSLYLWATCVRLRHYELRWIFTASFSVNDGLVGRHPYSSRSTHRPVIHPCFLNAHWCTVRHDDCAYGFHSTAVKRALQQANSRTYAARLGGAVLARIDSWGARRSVSGWFWPSRIAQSRSTNLLLAILIRSGDHTVASSDETYIRCAIQ